MAIARFKDLCIDANEPARLARFWAATLGLREKAKGEGEAVLLGPTRGHTVWVNCVPETSTVKNRVHLDIYATRLGGLEELGARVVRAEGDGRRWTVMADPEGNEFCAFLRPELPPERLHGLVVDSADAALAAGWW